MERKPESMEGMKSQAQVKVLLWTGRGAVLLQGERGRKDEQI